MTMNMLKELLPDRPVPVRIWRGPLRGARVVMNPRNSLRKIFGIFEHELNDWLETALHRVNRVIDVGAYDGYYTFGCAAAFQRLGKAGEIVAYEPLDQYFMTLQRSARGHLADKTKITLIQSVVGGEVKQGTTTLDTVCWKTGNPSDRTNTLVKIDVEGAEEEVLAGATSWLNEKNLFVIEVHRESFLDSISRLFADKGLILDRVDQRPLRLLGGEVRGEENYWLVSRLNSVGQ